MAISPLWFSLAVSDLAVEDLFDRSKTQESFRRCLESIRRLTQRPLFCNHQGPQLTKNRRDWLVRAILAVILYGCFFTFTKRFSASRRAA